MRKLSSCHCMIQLYIKELATARQEAVMAPSEKGPVCRYLNTFGLHVSAIYVVT